MRVEIIAAVWGGLVGAVAGGAVSFGQEIILAKRRERKALGISLHDHIEIFCGRAAAYWQTEGQNQVLELLIIGDLERLRRRIDRYLVASNRQMSGSAKTTLKQLQNLTTGGSFQTAGRVRDLEKLEQIRNALKLLQIQIGL